MPAAPAIATLLLFVPVRPSTSRRASSSLKRVHREFVERVNAELGLHVDHLVSEFGQRSICLRHFSGEGTLDPVGLFRQLRIGAKQESGLGTCTGGRKAGGRGFQTGDVETPYGAVRTGQLQRVTEPVPFDRACFEGARPCVMLVPGVDSLKTQAIRGGICGCPFPSGRRLAPFAGNIADRPSRAGACAHEGLSGDSKDR